MKSLSNLIPTDIAEALGTTMMHSLWQLAALGLLLLIALRILPQQKSKLRYWLATATMAMMLAAPLLTFALVYQPAQPAIKLSTAEMMVFVAGGALQPPSSFSAPGIASQVTTFFQANANWFLTAWFIGVFILSIRFLGASWQVRTLRRVGTAPVSAELEDRFAALLAQVGLRRPVQLKFSRLIDTPVVLGALKPIVLLPMGLLSGLSMEQVECVLIHELGHVRRWDYLVNLGQSLIEIILFYHPATWWVTKVMRVERENCCDELVVQLKSNKVQYARALLNLEVLRQQQPQLALSATDGDLMSRIYRITGAAIPRKRKFHAKGMLLGLLSFLCIVLLASQSSTVVKAALPFLGKTEPQDAGVALDAKEKSDSTTSHAPFHLTMNEGNRTWDVEVKTAAQDSPVTKVVMIDDHENIELIYDQNGKLKSGTRNGQPIPADQYAAYEAQAAKNLPLARAMASPMPAFPALPDLGPMPDLPALPDFGKIPAFPMPDLGGATDLDSKEFEKQMEKFGASMEKWGKDFGKQMETMDWDTYGKQMEAWGEQFGKSFEQADWSKFENDVERWAESFAEAQEQSGDARGKAIAQEREALLARRKATQDPAEIAEIDGELAELEAANGIGLDAQTAEFAARMQAWGEEFGRKMEQQSEALAEKMAAMAEKEADRAAARSDKAATDADRQARNAQRTSQVIGQELLRDGLIKNAAKYKIKVNDKELFVDGKKQSKAMHQKYMDLMAREMDLEIGKTDVIIQHNCK